jgi:hypothetical protein
VFPCLDNTGTSNLFDRYGNRQSLTTLGAAPLEDNLPVFGLHPLAKTVGALSFYSARLIGTLAHVTDSLFEVI